MTFASTARPASFFPGPSFRLSLSILFNPAFMRQYTGHETITAFFALGGYAVLEWADLQAIEKGELDAHVRRLSGFPSWLGMVDAAMDFFFADMYRCLSE